MKGNKDEYVHNIGEEAPLAKKSLILTLLMLAAFFVVLLFAFANPTPQMIVVTIAVSTLLILYAIDLNYRKTKAMIKRYSPEYR